MDLESPDVMKDFPGLYASEEQKKYNNNRDISDDTGKKDVIVARKKDKDKGYAALEGESSAEESPKYSPSKHKKTKSFKFTSSKSKEKPRDKRDKSKDKELDKKKDKEKKLDRNKVDKQKKIKTMDENLTLADTLPIFGVSLQTAVERSRCHDGIDIPLPVRQCIDYLEVVGIHFDSVYKISGTKSKVLQIKKMFNNREIVNLYDYDVPTSTSLLKLFLRELNEPIFTNELIIRFEEAGAILNLNTREKHLKILVDNLPFVNKLLLSWLVIHLDNVSLNEKQNRMSRSNLGASLNHTLHISSRLLTALIFHCRALFPSVILFPYVPPLTTGSVLPKTSEEIEIELKKQESLLSQIHSEMNSTFVSKQREELLWEVQRIITQLKRKLKSCFKNKPVCSSDRKFEKNDNNTGPLNSNEDKSNCSNVYTESCTSICNTQPASMIYKGSDDNMENSSKSENYGSKSDIVLNLLYESNLDGAITLLKFKNKGLFQLRETLIQNVQAERKEIHMLELQQTEYTRKNVQPIIGNHENLDKIMDILRKENQILQIKKIHLVRQIIEQREMCINLQAKLDFYGCSSVI